MPVGKAEHTTAIRLDTIVEEDGKKTCVCGSEVGS